jgi:hypothetical protein
LFLTFEYPYAVFSLLENLYSGTLFQNAYIQIVHCNYILYKIIFVHICGGSGLASTRLPVSLVSGEITNPQSPTEEEKELFLAIAERLIKASARKLLPHPINDVVKSLSREPFRKEIGCAFFQDKEVERVIIRVRTLLIGWDEAQAKKLGEGSLGAYSWNDCEIRIKMGIKTLKFTNYLMLNPLNLKEKEQDEFGKIENEGLLYHELLHGQLLIDAMQKSPSWQKKVCMHDFDFAPVDKDHRFIHDLQSEFIKKAAVEKGYRLTIKKVDVEEEGGDEFEFVLGEASEFIDKGDITLMYYVPPGCGISNMEFEVPKDAEGNIKTSGLMKIKGKITDKTRERQCYYWILHSREHKKRSP